MIKEVFGVTKPVIAMAHLPAIPGTPRYDKSKGVDGILEHVSKDIHTLMDGGVDGILFCNEDDRPYSFRAGFESVATMTRVICELRPDNIPFGVDFLWDPKATIAIAKASGANFIREVITGVYESDMGMWEPNAAELYRYRNQIDGENILVFANITPEFASPLGNRTVFERARSVVVSTLPDAVLISGPMAGSEPDIANLEQAKEAIGDEMPLFVNTGAKPDNIQQFLSIANGVIVGSSLKVDGYTWNQVDPRRVERFMNLVKEIR
jgi:membrane complex biogenesis BtpA family protein